MRKALNSLKADEAVEQILNMFSRTRTNAEFCTDSKKNRNFYKYLAFMKGVCYTQKAVK